MKHAFDEPVATPPALISLYAPIETELARFEAFLSTQLESDFPFVDQLVKHGFRLGGKRLRPALVLLSAKASGTVAEAHVHLAAVVELIHTATLVHDDVLDEALVRRHLDTVNARWNNETSVLLGDYLFTLALRVVASLEDSYAARAIGEASRVMCEGELRQIANRGNYSLGEP
ncbi:MAG: polyprenyl synthetase family protein, partial [Planctomycetota bacterium]